MAAEFAITLPAVLLVLVVAVGVLHAQAERVVLQDAVADAARILARGEDTARAEDIVGRAVDGAQVRVETIDDLVCTTASVEVALLPAMRVPMTARSCALGGGR